MADEDNRYRKYSVLVVDGDGESLEAFRLNFRNVFKVFTASNAREGMKILETRDIGVIVADQNLPGSRSGLQLLEQAKYIDPDIIGVMASAQSDPNTLIKGLNRDLLYRFVSKPWSVENMEAVVKQSLDRYDGNQKGQGRLERLEALNEHLRDEVWQAHDYERIVGASGGLKGVMEQARRVAKASGNVTITGEPGTGKELFARALHSLSPLGDRAFVKVDVPAWEPKTIEAVMFGLMKKTENGLKIIRRGALELANESSLYIKEITGLHSEAQVKFARALNEGVFESLNGNSTLRFNARVIVSSRQNPALAVGNRRFREDLLQKLVDFTVHIPPMRERKQDIPALVKYFIDRHNRSWGKDIAPPDHATMERLVNYRWPGNVSELDCLIKRAVLLADEQIGPEDIGFYSHIGERERERPRPAAAVDAKAKGEKGLKNLLDGMEKRELLKALKQAGGHKSQAARMLGINRSTLYYRMKKYGIGD